MKSLLYTLCILFTSFQVTYGAYSGHVFIESASSGKNNHIPLSGVVVTDGQHTVKTDKKGYFTLPGYEKTRFIVITTPTGYKIDKQYIKVDKAVKSYDFNLKKNEQTASDNHSFIQITDTEIHNRGVATNWVDDLKKYITSEKPAFLIHTGDICYESGLKSHIQVVNSETMGCPVYYGIGNHDLVKGEYGEQLYESIYGPTWYSFDVGNVHYVMTPMASGDYDPSYTKEEVYRWLKNDLAMILPGKMLVVFNHNMLTTSNDFYFGPSETERIDFRKYNLKAWIYGHWHYNYIREQNGIYNVCTGPLDKGGIDHSASAFRVFQMTKNKVESMDLRYCFVGYQAIIASPVDGQTTPLTESGKIPLSVNAYYSGSNVKQVSFTFKAEKDNRSGNFRPMVQQSDWNWYAEIPVDATYAGKRIEVEVKAEFTDGKTIASFSRFLYNPDLKIKMQPGDNWTNLLGNVQHSGNPATQQNLPLQLAWVQHTGANIFMSSPLIADNRVFAATIDDGNKRNAGVVALDIQTGKLLWKYPTRNSVKNSIAYDRQTVFAQDAEGFLYAIDAESGRLKWEKELNLETFYLEEGLIANDGIVYAGSGKGLGAYRVEDGTPVWLNTGWEQHEAATTTLTLGNGVLTAATQWEALYGNDAQTGAFLWKISEDGMSDRGASTTLHDGKFYVISKNSLFVIEPQTGKILTRKKLLEFNLDVTSTPLITDTEIVFGTADKGIVALDKESLSIKWTTLTGQSLIYTSPYSTAPSATVETSPVLSNGIIYFGASDGCLYGLKTGTGEIAWKVQTGSPVLASVAVSGNVLIAADFSGNVYAFASSKQ